MTKMIKLVSGDGQEIEVEEEVALQSKVIEDILCDSDGTIPLPLVHSKVLSQILEYCRKHATANSSPLTPSAASSSAAVAAASSSSDSLSSYCISSKPVSDRALSAWDKEFVNKLDPSSLYDLFMAANYLNVKGLLNLIAETIADMIRGKEPEQIREVLDIKNDFTPEEEAAVRSKHSWAFKEL